MKLPKNANIGQQSIAKLDSSLPSRVGMAQAGANNSFGRALNTYSELAMDVYRTDAAAERNDLNAEYHLKEQEMRRILEQNPYAQNEDGTMRSRHTEIVQEYEDGEKELRKSIMDKSTNNMAKRKLAQDFTASHANTRNAVHATAVTWAVESAKAKNESAIQHYIENYQYDEAGRALRESIALGHFTEDEARSIDTKIAHHATYNGLSNRIKLRGDVSAEVSMGRYDEINKEWNHMYPNEKKAAKEEIYKNRTSSFTKAIRQVIETGASSVFPDMKYKDLVGRDFGGLALGKKVIRDLTFMNPEDLGLETEQDQHRLIGALQSVRSEYKLGLENDLADMQADTNCDAALYGTRPFTRSNLANPSTEAEAAGVADDATAMNCAYGRSTVGLEPYTNEYFMKGIGREIQQQGHISKEGQRWISAGISNPAGNPQDFLKVARFVDFAQNKMKAGRQAFDFIDNDQMALIMRVNNMADISQQDAGDILQYEMDTINKQTPLDIKTREDDFDTNWRPTLNTSITDYYSGMFGKPLDPIGGNVIVPMEMEAEVAVLARAYSSRYGAEIGVPMAIKELENKTWTASNRSTASAWWPDFTADMRFEKNMPESTLRHQQGDPKKLDSMLATDWGELMTRNNLDPTLYRVGQRKPSENGEYMWPVMERGGNNIATTVDGLAVWWQPDYFNSTYHDLDQFESKNHVRISNHELAMEKIDMDSKVGAPSRGTIKGPEIVSGAMLKAEKALEDIVFPAMFGANTPEGILKDRAEAEALKLEMEKERAKYRKLEEWRYKRDLDKLRARDPNLAKRVEQTKKNSNETHEAYMERRRIKEMRLDPAYDR